MGQEAFTIRARLPYQREPLIRVLVEITVHEKILSPPQSKPIIHTYGEELLDLVHTYSLEEIIAEKASAMLSNAKKLHEKTWLRSRSRDYYDLWRIFNEFDHDLNKKILPKLVQEKCVLHGLECKSVNSFFQKDYIAEVKRTWADWLGPLVSDLPNPDHLMDDLRIKIQKNFF